MKIILRTFIFLYFIFLLILINILSISDYEWMIGEGDIDNLCQLPLNGRYVIQEWADRAGSSRPVFPLHQVPVRIHWPAFRCIR
ncbi:DUF2645 family protein [Proteus mirabilis]|uniref:DUF2645 family protein n=1 Tax=Proteus mirabilis TaxID=584 RepID=UPI003CFCE727